VVVSLPQETLPLVIPQPLRGLLKHLQGYFQIPGVPAYLVGGLPRDLVLGRATGDIDLAVGADALALGPALAASLDATVVVLDSANGVVRLVPHAPEYAGLQVDLSSLHGELVSDLERRDFTLDALAVDLNCLPLPQGDAQVDIVVLDPLAGLEDIRAGIVRATGDEVFRADGIRLLRAFRLMGELGFRLAPETAGLIQRDSLGIQAVAGERVRDELLRLFALAGTDRLLLLMQELGFLTAIIPELAPTVGVAQPAEHHWDVFVHSVKSVAAADFLLHRGPWEHAPETVRESVPWDESLAGYFAQPVSARSTRREVLKLAALLHDVAKPQTRVVAPSGRTRFFGHPQEGAPVAAAVLERLRFTAREVRMVSEIVRYHLRPVQASHTELPTKRAVYRYFRDLPEVAVDTLYFSLADHLAARGPDLDLTNWGYHANIVSYMLRAHAEQERVTTPLKLLDGHDLMRFLGVPPGPVLGRYLEELREAQAAGEVVSRQGALDYVKRLVKGNHEGTKLA
jgi:poly(A) polymerase